MKSSKVVIFSVIFFACSLLPGSMISVGSAQDESSVEDKTGVLNEETGNNLIPNPGFEEGMQGWGRGGGTVPKGVESVIDNEEFYSGKASHRIYVPDGMKLGWFGSYPDRAIEIEPNTTYRLSCWIQGKDIHGGRGAGAVLTLYDASGNVIKNENIAKQRLGTFMWEKIEKTFKPPAKAVSLKVSESYMAYGTVWFDDFRLIKAKEK